jgi:hypothetical protein
MVRFELANWAEDPPESGDEVRKKRIKRKKCSGQRGYFVFFV